ILNRLGLADGVTGPASFAAVRLVAGAITLGALVVMRRAAWPAITRGNIHSAATLLIYAIGFSYAYLTLDAGVGALILFGGVQITMFSVARLRAEPIAQLSWLGATLAFGGLAYLLWPGAAGAPEALGALLMLIAAVAWGLYTIVGRGAVDPLASTAWAFVLAAPVMTLVWLAVPDGISLQGTICAILSGAVTSGLGYAMWYRVLPQLSSATAAVAQLTVPVIAAFGGALLLAEPLTPRFALATLLVLGGVALTVLAQNRLTR
ncbi:MAG: DMT family transporter, partial [Pseudomonadota bacterium]